jgi:hypothetical protein
MRWLQRCVRVSCFALWEALRALCIRVLFVCLRGRARGLGQFGEYHIPFILACSHSAGSQLKLAGRI